MIQRLRRLIRRVLDGPPDEATASTARSPHDFEPDFVPDAHEALPSPPIALDDGDDHASMFAAPHLTLTPGKEHTPMPSRFLAWITPVDTGAHPEHPIVIPPGTPPGIWGGGNEPFPTPPIWIEIPPGVGGGDPPKPSHPIWWPIYPAHPIVIPPDVIVPPDPSDPPRPAHPIVIPPQIWGGANEPFPTHPIVLPPSSISPGVPAHPIVLPPVIWGGGNEPFPTPPIYLPPIVKPQPPGGTVENPIAYPIDLYVKIPGVGLVGPITIHYPGPLPQPLPSERSRR